MAETPGVGRRLWIGWQMIAGRFGYSQTLVILGFFYAFLIGPVAMVISMGRRDLLDKRHLRGDGSAWREADTAKPDLERAKLTS